MLSDVERRNFHTFLVFSLALGLIYFGASGITAFFLYVIGFVLITRLLYKRGTAGTGTETNKS